MNMHPHREISDLTLEQYALGELAPEKESRVRAALESDAALRARLEALRESDRQILAAYPAEQMAAAIRARLEAGRGLRRRDADRARQFPRQRAARRAPPLALALPIAAAALLFISFFTVRERVLPQLATSMTEATRLKGVRPHLTVYRKTAGGAEELASGQPARQRDVLQISYTAADARYGVIVSLDGRGTLTWHLPPGAAGAPGAAPALTRQGEVVLSSAYELDDAPGFERFFLVYSAASFDARVVEQAVRKLASRSAGAESAALALPPSLKQYSVVLKKQG
jgi:hypothetical protein